MTKTKERQLRVWHDRTNDGVRTGRTIAVCWDGDKRYVGVAVLPVKGWHKSLGYEIAVGRAQVALGGIRPERWPEMFSFSVQTNGQAKAVTTGGNGKLSGFLRTIPAHLFIDERETDEQAPTLRSQFA